MTITRSIRGLLLRLSAYLFDWRLMEQDEAGLAQRKKVSPQLSQAPQPGAPGLWVARKDHDELVVKVLDELGRRDAQRRQPVFNDRVADHQRTCLLDSQRAWRAREVQRQSTVPHSLSGVSRAVGPERSRTASPASR